VSIYKKRIKKARRDIMAAISPGNELAPAWRTEFERRLTLVVVRQPVSQNNLRYAYFPCEQPASDRRWGRIEVYDTTGYDIGGFGQQQGGGASLTFSSQRGVVRFDSLRGFQAHNC
jgi:hypothetical protein